MDNSLRYISISHKTTSTIQREKYHIPEEEKETLVKSICKTFTDVTGLFLLATCNRVEIYFEASHTSATEMLSFFIQQKGIKSNTKSKELFQFSNLTEDTVMHLLDVSSGLESLVFGDAEIIHQIKKSHQFSLTHQLQGSLLERALQAVFKNHKRISNETNFRDGTTSVAYKSLKAIATTFGKAAAKSKKILFIGAGDIVKQLFKYNSKFNYTNIYVSNRSEEKAIALSQKNQCKTYAWNNVVENKFEGFDVIISAASNCSNLIQNIPVSNQKTILIDLAVPCNINKALSENSNIIFHDLDSISVELQETKEVRLAAINEVKCIINAESLLYSEWLQGAALRTVLANYKITVQQHVEDYFETDCEDKKIKMVTNQVMRKIIHQTETVISPLKIDAIISAQASLLNI